MAQPLQYTPTPPHSEDAHEALDRLLETLYEAGVLRLVTDLIGQFEGVAEVAVGRLDTPGGRNVLSNAAVLVQALTILDPDGARALLDGLHEGIEAAGASLRDEPPSLITLLRRLNDKEVRRGLNAALVLLQTVARACNHADASLPTRLG